MPYRRTPRVQARLDAQRAAILGAAQQLLASGGYAGCSIAAVARSAGVSTGSVYTHFADKAELAGELFRVTVSPEVAAVRAAADATPDALHRITAVVSTFAGRALRSPRRAYALLAEPVDPAVDALRHDFRLSFRAVLADAIRSGVESGELPPQPAEFVAAALVGAIGEALVGPLAQGTDDDAAVAALIDFTHRAVGGRVHAHA